MEISIADIRTGEGYEFIPGALDTMRAVYGMVEEFHTVFGHPVRRKMVDDALLRLRSNLILEESRKEGTEALVESDLTKLLDSMADSLYVEVGTLVAIDGGLEAATKMAPDEIVCRWADQILHPVDVTSPTTMVSFSSWMGDGLVMASESTEEIALDALPRIAGGLYVSLQLKMLVAQALGIDLIELVRAVHESNMTKLWPADEAELADALAVSKYSSDDLLFTPCECRTGLIGYRKSDKKIMKSSTYNEVNLATFADNARKSLLWSEITLNCNN